MLDKRTLKRNLVEMKSKKLIKFINEEFPGDGHSYSDSMAKYQVIKQLSHNDLSSGIARMTTLETNFDNSKIGVFLVLIANLMLEALKLSIGSTLGIDLNDFKDIASRTVNIIYGLLILIFIFGLMKALSLDKNRVTTATYFKSLLEQAKAEKEKEKAS